MIRVFIIALLALLNFYQSDTAEADTELIRTNPHIR